MRNAELYLKGTAVIYGLHKIARTSVEVALEIFDYSLVGLTCNC